MYITREVLSEPVPCPENQRLRAKLGVKEEKSMPTIVDVFFCQAKEGDPQIYKEKK